MRNLNEHEECGADFNPPRREREHHSIAPIPRGLDDLDRAMLDYDERVLRLAEGDLRTAEAIGELSKRNGVDA